VDGRGAAVSKGLRAALTVQAFSEKPQPDWWLPSLAANFAMPATRRTYREEMVGFGDGSDLDPSRIALPVLVIHGSDDRLVPIAVGRALARLAPNARLIEVDGGSHMLPVTDADLLADEVARGRPPIRRASAVNRSTVSGSILQNPCRLRCRSGSQTLSCA